jgi:hypothetical protein
MVIGGVSRDWSIRLARLHELVATGADGPRWLWRIRIRILSYLLARYGGPEATPPPRGSTPPAGAADDLPPPAPEPAAPVHVAFAMPPSAVEHPPKAASALSPVLDEIHDANAGLRAARWENPPPEQVWWWWRGTWCRRS